MIVSNGNFSKFAKKGSQIKLISMVDSGDQAQDSGRKRISIVCWTEGPNDQISLPWSSLSPLALAYANSCEILTVQTLAIPDG